MMGGVGLTGRVGATGAPVWIVLGASGLSVSFGDSQLTITATGPTPAPGFTLVEGDASLTIVPD